MQHCGAGASQAQLGLHFKSRHRELCAIRTCHLDDVMLGFPKWGVQDALMGQSVVLLCRRSFMELEMCSA